MTQVGDALISLPQQVRHDLPCAGIIVVGYRVKRVSCAVRADQHDGDINLVEDFGVAIAELPSGNDDAVHIAGVKTAHHAHFLFGAGGGAAEEEAILVGLGHVLNALDDLGVERIADVRHHQANATCTLHDQPTRHQIGGVPHLLRNRYDTGSCVLADPSFAT